MTNKLLPVTVLLVLALDAPASRAGPVSPSQINSIILGDAATSDLATVVEFFGPDTAARLPFTGTVNSSGWSWQSTGTYLGQSLSLSSNGTFNPATNTGSWSSNGTLGGKSWSSTGSFRLDPAQSLLDVAEFGFIKGLEFDREIVQKIALLSLPPKYITTYYPTINGIRIGPKRTVTEKLLFPDKPIVQKLALERVAPPPYDRFVVDLEGTLYQGELSGTAFVAPVPEPPAWILLSLGMTGLVGFYGFKKAGKKEDAFHKFLLLPQ